MFRTSWRASLKRALKPLTGINSSTRLAIIGVGNELWGDDAAGVQAARRLSKTIVQRPDILIVDAGPAPENFSGVLRKFRPDFAILIDAVRPAGFPGRISWIELSSIDGISALTHGLPLSVLGEFFSQQLGIEAAVIGIEGEQFDFGEGLSPKIRRNVNSLARLISQNLSQQY
jgi:hydrogenase 3 maturation protease